MPPLSHAQEKSSNSSVKDAKVDPAKEEATGKAKKEDEKGSTQKPEVPLPAGDLDRMGLLQEDAIRGKTAQWGYWGNRPDSYSSWTSHSNRLIPVYVYGGSFAPYMNEGSVYRDESKLEALYKHVPPNTLNPEAIYGDQTDVYRLQKKSIEDLRKKHVFLVIFDGMDWQTTQAAAIYKSRKTYTEGVGNGLIFQDYTGTPLSYGYFVTAPFGDSVEMDVDAQINLEPVTKFGGYDPKLAGNRPWSKELDIDYPIGRSRITPHAYTDSSSSATSMTTGVKSINGTVNLDGEMKEVESIARWAQRTQGFKVGAVTSVPICHATPAAAYAANVSRSDYQDISRDQLGLSSVWRKNEPHPGLDVLIGCGWGEVSKTGSGQGANYVPGNRYLADTDRHRIDIKNGGKYLVAERTPGRSGNGVLREGAAIARADNHRFLGFFGAQNGHLPFRTANGDFINALSTNDKREIYSDADIQENPSLAQMTEAAISILETNEQGFWLMVESGDVDWANHSNNIDNSIGAVIEGEKAIQSIFNWIEKKDAWDESLVIITADHGHYFHLSDPAVFVDSK